MIRIDLLDRLSKAVWARQVPVIGCVRQHVLSPDQPWRYLRGNAILAAVGSKISVEAPFGIFDIWVCFDEGRAWILQFRGGQQSTWWREDCELLAALVATYTTLTVAGTALISELDGQLRITYFETPANAEVLSQEALGRWKRQERLNRQSARARYLCPHCPALKTCMAMDMATGETRDWPEQPLLQPEK